MPPTDETAHHPNTAAELWQAAAFLVETAREAAERGHDLLYAKRHRQINAVIDDLETLTVEGCWTADLPTRALSALLDRIGLPKAG